MTETTTTTDLVPAEVGGLSVSATVQALKAGRSNVMSTFKGDSFTDKVAVIDAMTNAKPLSENLGTVINLKNVVIQVIEMPEEVNGAKTGKMVEAPRIILVDEDGTSYAAISNGILKSLENFFGVLGQPDEWPAALPIVVTEERSRSGFRFMTASIAPADSGKAKK